MDTLEVEKTSPEADLFHRPARLMRVSSLASILSWVILAVAVILFGVQIYSLITQLAAAAGQYTIMQVIPAFFSPLMILMVGLFLAVILQVLAEGVYLVMDVEENTRKA